MNKITIIEATVEGLQDAALMPAAYVGHLDKQQCERLAREIGSGYPSMYLSADVHGAAFYACYSDDKNPTLGPDGLPEEKGHLKVWFYHTEADNRFALASKLAT